MIRFFKRHKITCLLLFILAYLIMGAVGSCFRVSED